LNDLALDDLLKPWQLANAQNKSGPAHAFSRYGESHVKRSLPAPAVLLRAQRLARIRTARIGGPVSDAKPWVVAALSLFHYS
jgi:hypothetical protein